VSIIYRSDSILVKSINDNGKIANTTASGPTLSLFVSAFYSF
jgi:hypothetical protein